MSEKNVLDQMELIDMEYVEAAVYPEVSPKAALTKRKWWKPAVATAAALVVGVCAIGFSPQIKAFADEFFNASVVFNNDERFEGKMEQIHINEGITAEQVEATYYNIEEVEELFGIKLLHSTKTSDKPVPTVWIFAIDHGGYIEIGDNKYYMYNQVIDLSQDENGNTVHTTGDGAYRISYTASFLTDRGEGNLGFEGHYGQAQYIETYTTANGLKAGIFLGGEYGGYTAVIFHNNIRYEIELDQYGSTGDIQTLRDYLDTLS